MSKGKDLPAPTNILTDAQRTWVVNELGRTENKLSVQIKFRKTFGALLPDAPVDELLNTRANEISELRKAHRNTIDSHKWGDARIRMEKYEEIAEKAIQGVLKGIDKNGNHIIEEDLKLALECVKACREEQWNESKQNIEMLKIYAAMSKNGIANTGMGGMVGAQDIPNEDDNITDAEETPTDTDKYFDE